MKKVLLLIISLLLTQASFAYETVLVDFPPYQGWHVVHYEKQNGESILQYVPANQTEVNWSRTLIFHSYKNSRLNTNAIGFLNRITAQLEAQNSSQLYKYTKYSAMDSIAVRCVAKNSLIPTQCEIYRASKSFEGILSMHYINKNVEDYVKTYKSWYHIIKTIRIYRSYYRTERIMDKADTFEL